MFGALFAAAVAVTMLAVQANQPEDVGYIRPIESPDPVAAIVKAHDCWTGAAPLDMVSKFPAHAVVNGRYVGRKLTDLAFDQAVGGHDHGLTVNAFCR